MEQKAAGFGGESIGGYSLGLTVFGKGEGEQAYFIVSAGKVSGEFSAEQIGIATGKYKVNALAHQTVDKQMPGRDASMSLSCVLCNEDRVSSSKLTYANWTLLWKRTFWQRVDTLLVGGQTGRSRSKATPLFGLEVSFQFCP